MCGFCVLTVLRERELLALYDPRAQLPDVFPPRGSVHFLPVLGGLPASDVMSEDVEMVVHPVV